MKNLLDFNKKVVMAFISTFIFLLIFCPLTQKTLAEDIAVDEIVYAENFNYSDNCYTISLNPSIRLQDGCKIFVELPSEVTKGSINIIFKENAEYTKLQVYNSANYFVASTDFIQENEISFDSQDLIHKEDGLNPGLVFIAENYCVIKNIRITTYPPQTEYTGVFDNVKAGTKLTAEPSIGDYTFIGWTTDNQSFISNFDQPKITAQYDGNYSAVYAKFQANDFVQLNVFELDENNLGIRYSFSVELLNMTIDISDIPTANIVINNIINQDSYTTMYAVIGEKTYSKTKQILVVSIPDPHTITIYISLIGVSQDSEFYTAPISVSSEVYLNNLHLTASTTDRFSKGISIFQVAQFGYEQNIINNEQAKIYGVGCDQD